MLSSKNLLPARLVRRLRGSRRSSPKSSPILKKTPDYSDSDVKNSANDILTSIAEDEETASVHCFDDFEEISRDEIPVDALDFVNQETRSLPSLGRTTPDISPPYSLASSTRRPTRPGRSKSVSYLSPVTTPLSRSFSRSSLRTLSRQAPTKPPPPPRNPSPVPEQHTEQPRINFARVLAEQSPVKDNASTFYDSDPFRRGSSSSSSYPADPNTLPPSPPFSRPASPSTITPSESRSTAYRRFASLRSTFRVPRRPKFKLRTRSSSDPSTSSVPKTPPPVEYHPLPQLVAEPFDLAFAFREDPAFQTPFSPFITVQAEIENSCTSVVVVKDPPNTEHLTVPQIRYECVNPLELTRSPSIYTVPELYSLSATPLPSSPAYLSRNIQNLERPKLDITSILHGLSQEPLSPLSPSPAPLIIPPPVPFGHIPPPNIVVTDEDFTNSFERRPSSYRSRRSSRHRSLSYSPSVRRQSATWKSRSPTVVAQSPASFLRRSHSFCSEASPHIPDHHLLFTNSFSKNSSAPDLLSAVADQPSSLLTPIDLFDSYPPSLPLNNDTFPEHEFFIPKCSSAESDDHLTLPQHILLTVIATLLQEGFPQIPKMSFNMFGKSAETVDFGEEVDYSDYQWFKDPPPVRHPASPAVAETFVPQPGVIEQNEMFGFALSSAPNVLYARYKQYGQLGVLAWCSEFSEMIDALKALGFEGNMFVATRTQALKACEEILRLHIDVKMQIIVMYLSSQIARLRRFLDGEQQWDDYPLITFPLPP